MRSLPFLSFALAAVRFGAAETFSRRALTRANIEQYVENIIIVKDDFSGMLLEIDVGNNEVLVQVDLSTSDLFVGGKLNGADKWKSSNSQALQSYPFFTDPVSDSGEILQANVSIGGKSAQQTFIFDSKNPFTDLTDAFPQVSAVGVLGFGPTGASSTHSVLQNSHSPIDQLILTNATNPYVTFFFIGSELAYNSPDAVPAGLFSIGEPVDLQALIPTTDGSKPPDLSVIHNQPAIPLGISNSFPVQQILHGGKNIPLNSSISSTPSGNAVGIIASTSPFNLVPETISQAIYSGVDGASFDQQTGLWHVPCSSQLTVEVVIANGTIVMENESLVIHLPGTSQCVGSFRVQSAPSSNWDISFGTTLLENVYILLGYSNRSSQGLSGPIMRLLPYADIQGAQSFNDVLGASFANTSASSGSNGKQIGTPGPSTRFTTVTVTHTPTTTVMIGGSTPTSSAAAASSDAVNDELAGALDVQSSPTSSADTPNGPVGGIADQLKHCLPAIIVLAIVVGLFLIGMTVYCLVSRHRKSGLKQSAYTNIHFAEAGDNSRALYGHDEDSTKYLDPYRDS